MQWSIISLQQLIINEWIGIFKHVRLDDICHYNCRLSLMPNTWGSFFSAPLHHFSLSFLRNKKCSTILSCLNIAINNIIFYYFAVFSCFKPRLKMLKQLFSNEYWEKYHKWQQISWYCIFTDINPRTDVAALPISYRGSREKSCEMSTKIEEHTWFVLWRVDGSSYGSCWSQRAPRSTVGTQKQVG